MGDALPVIGLTDFLSFESTGAWTLAAGDSHIVYLKPNPKIRYGARIITIENFAGAKI